MTSKTIEGTPRLGDVAVDEITGFSETVIAWTQWISGCDRLTLQPRVDKEGKVTEAVTFDVTHLRIITKGPKWDAEPPATRKTGGPRPEPTRAHDPR